MEEEFEETMDSETSSALGDTSKNILDDPKAGTIINLVQEKFLKLQLLEKQKNKGGYKPIEIIEVFMGQMFNLLLQKNLKYLLK